MTPVLSPETGAERDAGAPAPAPAALKQVLYAEDNLVAQMVMKRTLQGVCELMIVGTLTKAREIVAERRFDLIISDFLFPDGDAVEFIVGVRKRYSPTEVPLLLVSASLDSLVLSRVLKAGANDAMTKPLNVTDLRGRMDRLLTAPYMRETEAEACAISTFQWLAGGLVHEYCPELGVAVTGATKSEASKRMMETLRAHRLEGKKLGYTAGERVITHLLRPIA